MKGLFIVIEGIDGSGKTTQTKLLVERLKEQNLSIIVTAEPSDGPVGKHIKDILNGNLNVPPQMLALLFAADRIEHVYFTIKPALEQGNIVVSDRYYYSSIAYQGGMGVDQNYIRCINSFIIKPDLAFLINVDPLSARKRLKDGRKQLQLTEDEELQLKAFKIYEELVKQGDLIKIDGNSSIEKISNSIWEIVIGKLTK